MFAANYMKSSTEHLVPYYFNNNDLEMGSLFKEYQSILNRDVIYYKIHLGF